MKFPVCARRISSLVLVCALSLVTINAAEKTIRLRNEKIVTPPQSTASPSIAKATVKSAAPPVSGLLLLQLETTPSAEQRDQLAALGVRLLSYVPDDAFVIAATKVSETQLRALPFVRWVGPLRSEHKIHQQLNRVITNSIATATASNVNVSVLFTPQARTSDELLARTKFSRIAGQTELRQGTIVRGSVASTMLNALAESPAVLWIEPAPRMKLRDEIATKIIAGDDSNAGTLATVHQLGFTGAGVTVAVADSGLDSGEITAMHPDIAGRVTALFHYGALEDAADEHSHGTHCAGIVAGNGATGETDDNGYLFGLGVAPGANLIAQRIFDGAGGYTYTNASFEKLTRDAKLAGADIGSNSWGDDTQGRYDLSAMEFDALVRDAVSDAFAPGDQPYILEFSAGNAGPGEQTIGSPAVAKNVIATGAAQNDRPDLLIYGDGPDAMADFSSRGPCEDGRIKPDVTAPGTWIASLRSVYADDNNAWGEISPNYMYQGGTSQAGPHVSGAAAVFVQYWRSTHTNATPSPAMVKAALINSATDMDETAIGSTTVDENGDPINIGFPQEANPVPNQNEGWGRVDLTNLIGTTRNYQFVDQTVLLTNQQVFEQRLLVGNADAPLKITLAYTDVPGTPLTVPALVNDLDLEVLAPDGHVYHGNQFFAGESIADATAFDALNNVEAVHLAAPVPGEYVIRIRARNIPMDARRDTAAIDQDFALVASGHFAPPGTGIVTFDRRVYSAPASIKLRLVDYDLTGQPTATITLRSTTESTGENITLFASGTSGSFTAIVATATGPALNDGKLQLQHNDTITAVYQDASPAAQRTFTARADLLPPVISGVATTNRFGKTQVRWNTDEPAQSVLVYGATTALGSALTNTILLTNHTAIANNQVAGQTNYFYLVAIDEAGNRITNNNGGQLFRYVVPFSPPVLVVDGYFGDIFVQPPVANYTACLDALGIAYDVWDAETLGAPTAADLRPYRVVLWRIAEFSTSSPTGLTIAEQNAIRAYLDSGGALFMASMELISRLGVNTPFVREILHVNSFSEDVGVTGVAGVADDAIGNGLGFDLDFTDYTYLGIVELNYTDTMSPGTGAEGFLTDTDSEDYVALRFPQTGVDSPGRVVFLSFPLDTIPLSDPAPNNRTELLRRCLQFLAPGLNGQGSIAFNRSAFATPSQATVEVADSDLEGLGQINITLRSTVQTNALNLALQETSRRGVFRGSFAIVPAAAGSLLPELRAVPGNTITATYFDASSAKNVSASVPVENTPPIISGLSVAAGYVDAVVSWSTDELADSRVEFGESALLNRTAIDTTPTTAHAVTLPQLEPARTYYYRIISTDRAGNTQVAENNGALYTFSTRQPKLPPWTDNLEGVNTNWTVYTVEESERGWELGVPGLLSPAAHSPSNAWGSNLSGEYASTIESYLISPAIQLTGGNLAKLKFWHAYDFTTPSELDIMHAGEVLLLTDNALEPISLGVFSDDVASWTPVEVDLTPHLGKVVYIAWHYFLFSLDALPRTGWLVDDVSITVSNTPTGTLLVSNNLWQATFTLTGPTTLSGSGRNTTFTNAPAGDYAIQFGNVPYFATPATQTNRLNSGNTNLITGLYSMTDANTNGIPDGYELEKFGSSDATRKNTTDTDRDGLSDWAEFVAGTDPLNPPLPFQVTATRLSNNLVRLQWPSLTNQIFRVHASSNGITWTPHSVWFNATNLSTLYPLATTTNGAARFFRVEAAVTNGAPGLFQLSAAVLANKQIRLDWTSAAGHGYRVWGSTNLFNWALRSDWLRATAASATLTLPAPTNNAPSFFRIEAQP